MRGKANHIRWLLCMLFLLAAKQTVFAHNPPPEPPGPPKIIYVDADSVGANDGSSWADAFNYLRDALATASPGDEIRVAEGTYKPNQGLIEFYSGPGRGMRTPGEEGRSATFELKFGLSIKGGFAGFGAAKPNSWDPEVYETILSGDLDGNDADVNNPYDYFYEPTRADNSVHVVTSIVDDASTVLDGFVVTGAVNSGMLIHYGSPTILNCVFSRNSSNEGGAISIWQGQSLFKNCKFISNMADTGGALFGMEVDLTLSECSFTGNWANDMGGGASILGNATLTGCVFLDNTSQNGGGIVHSSGELVLGKLELIDCAFSGNLTTLLSSNKHERSCNGGAVWTSVATARNCTFSGNLARYGGAVYGWIQSVENCMFTGNMAEQGGALYGMQSSTIKNSIFTGNRAEEGGVLYSMGLGPSLTGCTLSDNSAQNGNAIAWGMRGHSPAPLSMTISNCILWNGGDEFGKWEDEFPDISIVYSDIQGGWPGEGNIDLDPFFAQPGYWDPNETPDDPNDDFWIDGDYHLKSQAGRWDPASESWVVDDITSPCIDAGDTNSPVAFEPFPNGGIINMGAYGGTVEASKSPSGIHAKYGGGSGTDDDPYLIYTVEQMNEIGLQQEDWDKHFKLMADIDLSGYKGTDFNIIGFSNRNAFSGVFDGNGHTISNFSYTSSNGGYKGLFGYVSGRNAQVKNLGLIAPDINAGMGSCVGSLAGYVSSGTITNCHAEGGSVAGKKWIGGLVGWNSADIAGCYSTCNVSGNEQVGGLVGYHNSWEITDCYAGGVIFGRQYVGGLAGTNSETIKNSYATGTVGGGGRNVGGLVGRNSGRLFGCSASGDVFGDSIVGGLAGNSEDAIVNCYATGDVFGTDYVGGLVGRIDYSIVNCYAIGTVSGSTYSGGIVGLRGHGSTAQASFWDIETSGQLIGDGGTGKTTAEMRNPNTFMAAGWNFVGTTDGPSDIWASPEGGGYPVLWWQLSPLPELPAFSGGTGTADDPYLISTADELNSIGHNPRLMSVHFQLTNDIDLAGIDFFIIGGQWHPFGGTFDGNGYTISNFTYTSEYATHTGFFGNVVEGQIKNLGLIGPNVEVDRGDFHGCLVGNLEGGAITNSYVEAGNISGNDYVGGLIGFNSLDSYIPGSITNCYVTGSVAGDDDVGGLVGSNDGAISDCYAIADVNGNKRVGGLIGASNYISFGHAGGIRSSIERCYSAGRVSGDEDAGGLVGQSRGEIANSFWDTETSGQSASAGGEGKTTAEMQTAGTFLDAGWDFTGETTNGTEDIWWILDGQDYPRLWLEYAGNGE